MRKIIQAAALGAAGILLSLFCVYGGGYDGKRNAEQAEGVTVTWFVALDGYEKNWDPENSLADAKILEKTGINLEITSGSLTDLDALIATDALPDLITVEAGAPERSQIEDSGMAAPLEPLFEAYAPEAAIPASMKEWYRNRDGNWYSIASYYYGPERVNEEYGGYLECHNGNYVRTDLLAQTGIGTDELQTKEGLLRALQRAGELTYQGQEIIPFSGWWTQSIAEQFGMRTEDEEGEFLSMYRQPEWLEALRFGNQLYREGLLSEEEFTESDAQRLKQVESGRVFFCSGYSNVKDAREVLRSRDKAAVMDYVGQIRGDAGNIPHLKSVSSGGWTATMIRKDAENVKEIIRFIAYMTGEEATLDAAPSIGTGTYEIRDGICVRKESVEQEFQEDYEKAAARYYLNLEFFVDWTVVQKYQPPEERDIFRRQFAGCEIYDSKTWDAAMEIRSESPMFETKRRIDEFYRSAEIDILTSPDEGTCLRKYRETIQTMEELGLEELEACERRQYREAGERLLRLD